MSFKRLDPEDFVVGLDPITAPLWSRGNNILTSFYTSSTQELGNSGFYYLDVFQTSSDDDSAEIQFNIAYGNKYGSGSQWYNNVIPDFSPTKTIYGQYRNLVLGDENSDFIFGNITSSDLYTIAIDRKRYKQSLLPGSLTLILSGSTSSTLGSELITNGNFTTNANGWTLVGATYDAINSRIQFSSFGQSLRQSGVVSAGLTYEVTFTIGGNTTGFLTLTVGGAGSYGTTSFNSPGTYTITITAGSTNTDVRFSSPPLVLAYNGWIDDISVKEVIPIYTDISITDNSLITPSIQFCDAGRIFQLVSGSAGQVIDTYNNGGYTSTGESYGWLLPDTGLIILNPNVMPFITNQEYNTNSYNNQKLYQAIVDGGYFALNNQENVPSSYIFVRARNAEFNYSENPSFVSNDNAVLTFDSMIEHPQTFPTTIGLYNDNNDLLAVAKLSKPISKDFTKEALVRVKLDF